MLNFRFLTNSFKQDMARASVEFWNSIERLPTDQQKHLLQRQLQTREPIHSFKDIRLGDHLVRKNSFLGLVSYEHHFICVGFNGEGKPLIVHYYSTPWKATAQLIPSITGCGSPFEQLAVVQEMCIEEYVSEAALQTEGNEVARVVWPEELLRYPPEERVKKARGRAGKKEKWYDLEKNNCETLIMWCFCDLQISLQVTAAVRYLREVIGSGYNSLRQSLQQVPKVVVEQFGDDIILAVMRLMRAKPIEAALPKGIGVYVGAAVSIFAEAFLAYREIMSAKQKWKEGIVMTTRQEFIKEVIDSVLSAPLRAGGSIGGMTFGQFLIPIPVLGGIIGAAIGAFACDYTSKWLTGFDFTEFLAHCIDSHLSPDKLD